MTFTGILIAKNASHIVDLTIRSSSHALDNYILIDNFSDDSTFEVMEETVRDYNIDAEIYRREGYVGYLFEEIINTVDYGVRLEADQVYFRDRFSECLDLAVPHATVSASVYMIRNRVDLTRWDTQTNAPHPTVYHNDGTIEHYEGMLWPRSFTHEDLRYRGEPIGVNLNIASPEDRIRRWHRTCWWRRGSDGVPDWMELDGYDRPYDESLSLEEYIWKLREEEKGSFHKGWHGDSLEEIGEEFLKWDIENRTSEYTGPYPEVLEEVISEGRFEEYEISV